MSDDRPYDDQPGGQPPNQPPYQPPYQPSGSQPPGGQPPYDAGGGTGGYQPYPSGGNQLETGSGAGFFGALFDFSFHHFVTPKIVKFVYVLATIVLALVYVGLVIAGFTDSAGTGLFLLIVGAIGFIVYLAFIRMTLEFYFAIVRMSQDINRRLPGA